MPIKDDRSVSLNPFNRSQILQYVKCTKKITLHVKFQNVVTNNVLLDKKSKNTTTTKQNQT